jgi:uncharacterized protein
VPHIPGCDPELVLLFALFHDSRRFNEFTDPEHGLRGGELARSMLNLEPERIELLADACTRHDKGFVSDDPTVGTCWDADRLNLWRVGIRPKASLLSTAPAPLLVDESAAYHGMRLEWHALFSLYDELMA